MLAAVLVALAVLVVGWVAIYALLAGTDDDDDFPQGPFTPSGPNTRFA